MSNPQDSFKSIAYILGKHQASPGMVKDFSDYLQKRCRGFDPKRFEEAVEKFRRLPLGSIAIIRGPKE